MEEKLLEIREYTGPGYQSVIDFGVWRVAILNYLDEIHPKRIDFMERLDETDEVFILLQGQAVLFLGEGDANHIDAIHSQVMDPGKIYNVKQSVWHTVVLSREGSVLIVENRNTSDDNSQYVSLDREQRSTIINTSGAAIVEWK